MSSLILARSGSRQGSAQFGRRISQLFLAIELALQVRRERRMLAGLSDGMLKDIGLTRADVHRETGRALWDVPADR
ncbi:MAG TPA: DUF1127 domain-containing protein [Hyphomicrobiaceae bacterium]|nr:DUF1127 domain-containing protein [Hyphomicrobiaceae bacterium]